MSRNRTTPNAGYVRERDLPRGPNGRALCRWCGVEVTPPRRTFCSDACIHEHKLRSNPGYVREQVFARDRGVCAACGRDCSSAAEHGRLVRLALPPLVATPSDYAAMRRERALRAAHVRRVLATLQIGDGSGWDADHVLPVVEGGGECGLEGYRTLCRPCHKRATAELATRRAAARRRGDDA